MKTVHAVMMNVIFDIFVSVILVHVVLKSCACCFVLSTVLTSMFGKHWPKCSTNSLPLTYLQLIVTWNAQQKVESMFPLHLNCILELVVDISLY